MSSLGNLKLQLVEAHLTHDVKMMRKMDPYVKVVCREFVWKSKADRNGSKKPKWDDQHFEIDVHYMGDDIYYKVFDEDKGKDEKVGDGSCKISTFCAEPEMDLWMEIEYKGKAAGKVRFTSKWEPKEGEHSPEEQEGMQAKAQEALKKLAERKHELEGELEAANAATAEHEATYPDRLAALEGCNCQEKFDEAVAAAEGAYAAEMERIEKQRALAQEGKEDFEKSIANQVQEAAANRDVKAAEIEEADAAADVARDEALAAIEEGKAAAAEAKEAAVAEVKADVERIEAEDQAEYDRIADEIKEIAEKLLEMNEKMNEKLTALTNL